MRKEIANQIKSCLKPEQIEAYRENGCNIVPFPGEELYRIDYWAQLDSHPRGRDFGSMAVFDVLDCARAVAKEHLGVIYEKLAIPVLVFTIKVKQVKDES